MEKGLAKVYQLSVSDGGVPKLPVGVARIDQLGLEGDKHNDLKHHGGPDRAVCLYSLEIIRKLQSEGHPAYPGSVGENLTVEGLAWDQVVPGVRLAVGDEVLLEVTQHTTPCFKIKGSFSDGRFGRISQKTHPGEARVYARVLRGGTVRPEDTVTLLVPQVATEPPNKS